MKIISYITIFAITAVFSFCVNAQNEIPNADFENWTGITLDGWSHNGSGPIPVVQPTDDAYSGNSAVHGEVLNIAGVPFPPSLFTGTAFEPFFPVTDNYQTLEGYYKYDGQGGDLLFINVVLLNFDQGGGAEGHLEIGASADSYTHFEIPLVYDDDNPPGWQATTAAINVTILPPTGSLPSFGTTFYLDHVTFDNIPLAIGDETPSLAGRFTLRQNYPNPFNPSTTLSFFLPKASDVELAVFDQLGRKVGVVVSQRLTAGDHSYDWRPEGLASGAYFYKITAGNLNETRRMLFLK